MVETNDMETIYLNDEISRCETVEQLRQTILPLLKSQKSIWEEKIAEIFEETGYTKTRFAELCGVSRVSVDKWCKGALPKNRETFLRIALAANYDIENTNQLLQRYGRYPALYSKSLEDCICIFVINSHFKEEEKIQKYQYILNRIQEQITKSNSGETQDITTEKFEDRLLTMDTEDKLEQFIAENIAIFSMAYHKFYAYVKFYIEVNGLSSQVQFWPSSLRQCVYAIRQNKWYPTRNNIIILGLYLCMDHEQVDEMLQLAHMEPLCAKNIIESVLIFILEDASLNNLLDTTCADFYRDALSIFARRTMETLNLPELDSFISKLPEDNDETQKKALTDCN